MGEQPPDVTAHLLRERDRYLGHVTIGRDSILVAFFLLAVFLTMFALRPDNELAPAAALAVIVAGWLAVAGWFHYGRRWLARLYQINYDRNRRMLAETDLLYLAIEHRPAECLAVKQGAWNRVLFKSSFREDSFIHRIEDLVKNMDTYAAQSDYPREHNITSIESYSAFTACLPCCALLVAPMLLDVIFERVLILPAFLVFALVLLISFIPVYIDTCTRWQLVVDVLMGDVDLVDPGNDARPGAALTDRWRRPGK